ncbi:MAG: potassium transporter TrkG, partial [Muribaculaceae bacterium]
GASVIRDVEAAPHGILMWRAMIQWVGGMGIILFTLAVIPMLNHQGGIQLFNAEVTGISHDKLRPRISQTAKGLWLVYIVLTIIMVILLWVGPMNLFDSVCQTMAAVSTGGFSTRNASIAAWDSHYVNIVVLIFMFICGINFSLLYKAALRNFRPLL